MPISLKTSAGANDEYIKALNANSHIPNVRGNAALYNYTVSPAFLENIPSITVKHMVLHHRSDLVHSKSPG
jgi:hypothetical protein